MAICAHHRLRQSLFVRLGMCLAMACHLEGGLASPSSAVVRYGLVRSGNASDGVQRAFLDRLAEELVLVVGPCSAVAGLSGIVVTVHSGGGLH